MPQTNECDFCGGDIEPGTGTMFVRTDGTTVRFCSSKCEKNADLGRRARDLEWTSAGEDRRGAAESADTDAEAGTDEDPAAATAATESPANEEAQEPDEAPPGDEDGGGADDADEADPEEEEEAEA